MKQYFPDEKDAIRVNSTPVSYTMKEKYPNYAEAFGCLTKFNTLLFSVKSLNITRLLICAMVHELECLVKWIWDKPDNNGMGSIQWANREWQ